MKCANHPNAPAIENCENCATPLCAICAAIVIARSTVFAPQQEVIDPQLQALEFNLISLAECMVTFQQIGESLAAGERPDPTMRCSDSPQPNRVIESDDNLIVEHPQPEYYGYSSLSVSRSNPAPVLGPSLPQI